MQNMCLKTNIIYEATVSNNTDIAMGYAKRTVTILDLSGYNIIVKIHNYLNMYVEVTENKIPFNMWIIFKRVYNKPRFNYCKLCLMEKLYINNSIGDKKFLNKKSEFASQCRHENKKLIKSVSR